MVADIAYTNPAVDQGENLVKRPIEGKLDFIPVINEWIGGFDYIYNDPITKKLYFQTNYKAPKFKVITLEIGDDNFKAKTATTLFKDLLKEHP